MIDKNNCEDQFSKIEKESWDEGHGLDLVCMNNDKILWNDLEKSHMMHKSKVP